ncbi:hypothetical protein FQN60_006720, partial [Etheostoma spectabile]
LHTPPHPHPPPLLQYKVCCPSSASTLWTTSAWTHFELKRKVDNDGPGDLDGRHHRRVSEGLDTDGDSECDFQEFMTFISMVTVFCHEFFQQEDD